MLQQLSITVQGLDRQTIYAESIQGREALNEAYEFVIDIVSHQPVGLEDILGKTAKIELRVVEEDVVINGVIAVAMALDPTPSREFCYRFTVVPELALMKLSGQNQVYGTESDVTVVDIISKELADGNKAGSKTAGSRASRSIQSQVMAESGN